MSFPTGPEAIIVLIIILVLFGAKRLPELGKSLGQGIKEFRKSAKTLVDDDDEDEKKKDSDSKSDEGPDVKVK
jgi:sec-independent protein translocase protein TatA